MDLDLVPSEVHWPDGAGSTRGLGSGHGKATSAAPPTPFSTMCRVWKETVVFVTSEAEPQGWNWSPLAGQEKEARGGSAWQQIHP